MSLVWMPAPGRTRWKYPLALRPVYCVTRLPLALRSSACQKGKENNDHQYLLFNLVSFITSR